MQNSTHILNILNEGSSSPYSRDEPAVNCKYKIQKSSYICGGKEGGQWDGGW